MYQPKGDPQIKRVLFMYSSFLIYSFMVVCLFYLGFMSLSITFQLYREDLDMAGSSVLTFRSAASLKYHDMIFHPVTLYWHWANWANQFLFLALLS